MNISWNHTFLLGAQVFSLLSHSCDIHVLNIPFFSPSSKIYHLSYYFIITWSRMHVIINLVNTTNIVSSLPVVQWLSVQPVPEGHEFNSRRGLRFFHCPMLGTY